MRSGKRQIKMSKQWTLTINMRENRYFELGSMGLLCFDMPKYIYLWSDAGPGGARC